ncbi:MAG TPA: hypothetical protein VGZ29_05620 [Terriglobia bacterium]|nr:hypothetical protein [Terriglobia bacterium]
MSEERDLLWHLEHDGRLRRGDGEGDFLAELDGVPVDIFSRQYSDSMPVFTTVGNQRDVIRVLEALGNRCRALDRELKRAKRSERCLWVALGIAVASVIGCVAISVL